MPSLIVGGLESTQVILQGLGPGGGGGGGGFVVLGAVQVGPLTIRVEYSQPPLAFDPAGANDAINPASYDLLGPVPATVVGASPVADDPAAIDVYVGVPLAAGAWTIEASASVQDLLGNSLAEPREGTFAVSATPSATGVDGGARNEGLIRRHLNPALRGKTWDHLIAALEGDAESPSVGDGYVSETARAAFDQLFLSTASGPYLDRRAGEVGVRRPEEVGIPDEAFRQLALTFSAARLTDHAIHDVLEVFYSSDALRATLAAGHAEPYALQDGDDLVLEFGADRRLTVVLRQAQFARAGAASAQEVAAALNRAFLQAGLGAFAAATPDPATGVGRAVVYADVRGLASTVRVLGGRAQVALRFPHDVLPSVTGPFGTWTIAPSGVPGRVRLTASTGSPYDLSLVQPGDAALVYGREFPTTLHGTLDVLDVSVSYPGGVLTQWFEVSSPTVSANVTQLAESSLVFLRPTLRTIHDQPFRSFATDVPGGLEVLLPVTTQVVQRSAGLAGYLASPTPVAVSAADRDAAGRVLLTLAAAHGLAPGDHVLVDEVAPAPARPTVSAGTPSGTLGPSML